MKVYCKNESCAFFKRCENHLLNRGVRAINQFDSDIYKGECKLSSVRIDTELKKSNGFLYKDCCCKKEGPKTVVINDTTVACDSDCTHNSKGFCTKHEVGILKSANGNWACALFSNWKRAGHMDFSNFPKGGHVDDQYADKMAADKLKIKSYPKFIKDYDK